MHAIVRVCCRRGPRIVIAPRDGLLAQIDRHGHRAATTARRQRRGTPHCHQLQAAPNQQGSRSHARTLENAAGRNERHRKEAPDRPKVRASGPSGAKLNFGAAMPPYLSTFTYTITMG